MAATRTKADIEAEIAAARSRLAGNVEELITTDTMRRMIDIRVPEGRKTDFMPLFGDNC